jgi:TrpR-related protein YerC/YecD
MPRARSFPVNPRLRDPQVDRLCRALLTLERVEECYRFLEDLCTINETKTLAARLEVARLLHAGMTYEEVARRTGASSATISRVRRFLEYGADGYHLVLERMARGPS